MSKEDFFRKMDRLGLSLTYGDVKLKTGYSETMPADINLESKFSRNIPLKIPLVSAAMDTVTEHKTARTMAILGGLGVIHKNLSPEEQANQVAKVKYFLNGKIKKPVCINGGNTVEQVLNLREQKDYSFHSFPVINDSGSLVGIITKDDFDFCDDYSVRVEEIMTERPFVGNPSLNLDQAYEQMKKHKKKSLPLVDNQSQVVGLYVLSDIKRIKFGNGSSYNIDDQGQLRVAAAIGVYDDAFERVEKLIEENIDVVVIDTAHADSKPVLETLRILKKDYSGLEVVAGNISQPESVSNLLDAGADGAKVGQGPGSICTTRIVAGVGTPQVDAVYRCACVSDEPICADGGMTQSGDIPIAIGAGAHSVMMGSMLAGTEEAPGELVFVDGQQWKSYRGMGSLGAMQEHKGSRDRYQQTSKKLVPEGVEGLVPYKGKLIDVIAQYVGGLRAGAAYVGAADMNELRKKADFVRLSGAGQVESHPHHIQITKDAPNYSGGK